MHKRPQQQLLWAQKHRRRMQVSGGWNEILEANIAGSPQGESESAEQAAKKREAHDAQQAEKHR